MALTVLHFIVCDRVYANPENLHSINVEGLKTLIRSRSSPPFPLAVTGLRILAMFMGGEGEIEISFRVVRDTPKRIITASAHAHRVRFVGEPQEIKGLKGFLQNCRFPHPGLYWVELLGAGEILARQPLRLV